MSEQATPCRQVQEHLSAYLDGELTQQQRQHVDVHLADCPTCRRVFEDLMALQENVGRLEFPTPDDRQWSRIMRGISVRATRGLGWLLTAAAVLILTVYGIYEFATDPAIAAIERICVLALILGGVMLLVSVLAERLIALPHDRYKDIEK